MNWGAFITCAVTGSGETAHKSDKVPVTPEQIGRVLSRVSDAQPVFQIFRFTDIDNLSFGIEHTVDAWFTGNVFEMEYHDTSSEGHAQDVSKLSNEIGVELGLSNAQLEITKFLNKPLD